MMMIETGSSSSRSTSSRNRSRSSGRYLSKVLDHRCPQRVLAKIHEKVPLPSGCWRRALCKLELVLASWFVEERVHGAPAILEITDLLLELGLPGDVSSELDNHAQFCLQLGPLCILLEGGPIQTLRVLCHYDREDLQQCRVVLREAERLDHRLFQGHVTMRLVS